MRRKDGMPSRKSARIKTASGNDGKVIHVTMGEKWLLREKKQFLEGLKKYGPHNLELIQKEYVPHRHIEDIKNFICAKQQKGKRLLMNIEESPVQRGNEKKTPIEIWIKEAEDLTTNEHDHSFALGRVFSMFSTLEPHDKLSSPNAPNYRLIYQYIAAILQGRKPPRLSGDDASVLLDLVNSLGDDLKSYHTASQRQLMQLKYNLLSAPSVIHSKAANNRKLRQALEEDPLESLPKSHLHGIPQKSSGEQASSTAVGENTPSTSATNDSTPQPSTPANSTPQPSTSANNTPQPSTSANSTPQPSTSANCTPKGSAPNAKKQEHRPVKTPLYTLNPFCIPIKYLRMKSVV